MPILEKREENIDLSYNNEFELQLKEAGYKWFKDNWKNSIRGFQKRFTDEKGTKYFITGYHYNHKKQLNRYDLEDKDSYSFDVQFQINKYKDFYTDENGNKQPIYGKSQTIDLHFSADFLPNKWRPVTTLKEVEEFYEKAWVDMNADYYELNNY